jgi:hypothetical protein
MNTSIRSLNGVARLILSIKLETLAPMPYPNQHLLILNVHHSVVASTISKCITQFEDNCANYNPKQDFLNYDKRSSMLFTFFNSIQLTRACSNSQFFMQLYL